MATYIVDATRPNDTGSGLTLATAKRTIRGARNASASGDTIEVMSGQYHDSLNGAFFVSVAGVLPYTIKARANGDAGKPVWDNLTYQNPGSAGWAHVSGGVWKKTFGAWYTRRLFVASRNNGVLHGQRTVGPGMRRAPIAGVTTQTQNESEANILAALSAGAMWAPGGAATGWAVYVYTGSSVIAPPDFYGGLALLHGDAVSFGAGEHCKIENTQNLVIRDQVFRGIASAGVRCLAQNTNARDAANILVEDCDGTHIHQNMVRLQRNAELAPTWMIRGVDVNRCTADYTTNAGEQEQLQTESALSGAGDAYVADHGVFNARFRNSTARNPFHVGIAFGSTVSNLEHAHGCSATKMRVEFDSWFGYGRGAAVYNGTGHLITRSEFVGQNVRSQFAGGVTVAGNKWTGARASIRKPGTDQWCGVEGYIFDNGSGLGNSVRYVQVTPTAVDIRNNSAEGFFGSDYVQMNSFPHGVASPNAWGTVSFRNNNVASPDSIIWLRGADGGGNAAIMPTPAVQNNNIFNSTLAPGGNRVTWKGANYTLASAPGHAGNTAVARPAARSGVFAGHARDFNGVPFNNPPSIGAVEAVAVRRQRF